MIYKYLTANVPVPSNLLIPIRKAIQSAVFPGFSIGSYPSHSYGWGSLHIGFSGKTDPEPGRCRRTDGKKWRCSKDAVPDQKYCERHINRGRHHRSRKPVEGRTGQAASGAAATKVSTPAMSASMSSLVTPGGGAPNGIANAQHHTKGLPIGATNVSSDPISKRHNDQLGGLGLSTINLEPKEYSIPKQHRSTSYGEFSIPEFGIVSNDALLNPSQESSYSLLDFNTQRNHDEYPPRHFVGNWPKDPSHHTSMKSDWTQLSMSIPMSMDLSSSSSSPNHEKVAVSPLNLGIRTIVAEGGTNTNAWLPIGFENTMGGPLGEVLFNNTSDSMDKNEGWNGSPQFDSSPTGVLQRSTFVSLSNSSSVGSPTGENLLETN